jgi:hypothetical protein
MVRHAAGLILNKVLRAYSNHELDTAKPVMKVSLVNSIAAKINLSQRLCLTSQQDQPPQHPQHRALPPLYKRMEFLQPPDLGGTEPPTGDQGILPQDSILQQQQQLQQPADQGAAELPPTTEETQPATAEEEQPVPVCQEGLEFNENLGFCVPSNCPEGQELDEETGLCVLEEQEEIAEEEEPQAEEPSNPQSGNEEQTPDQGDSSEDNSNN